MPIDISGFHFESAPVTHILPKQLSKRVILCCGEVDDDFVKACKIFPEKPLLTQSYRSYKLWKYTNFTAILAGIGTGMLEPLLWEIQRPGIVHKIVLVGTAGAVTKDAPELGKALPIGEAYSCGTGIDGEIGLEPVKPRWNLPEGTKTCAIASSDFFYGYSDRVLDGSFKACQGAFREKYTKLRDKAPLIDMEVAQFYYLCPKLDPTGKVEYIAVKGSSNAIGKGEDMNTYATSVLEDCIYKALRMLEIVAPRAK